MNKREIRKLSIDEQILREMRKRQVGTWGAIQLARELELPWRVVARSLRRLAAEGRIVEQVVKVEVSYRFGGETTRKYSLAVVSDYPEWLQPAVRLRYA